MKQHARSRRFRRSPLFVAAALLLILIPTHGDAHGLEVVDCIEPMPEGIPAPLFSGLGDAEYGLIESLNGQGKSVPTWLRAKFRRAWRNASAPLSLSKM